MDSAIAGTTGNVAPGRPRRPPHPRAHRRLRSSRTTWTCCAGSATRATLAPIAVSDRRGRRPHELINATNQPDRTLGEVRAGGAGLLGRSVMPDGGSDGEDAPQDADGDACWCAPAVRAGTTRWDHPGWGVQQRRGMCWGLRSGCCMVSFPQGPRVISAPRLEWISLWWQCPHSKQRLSRSVGPPSFQLQM